MSTIEIILISAASGIAVAALIYGFIRKASRISWLGWQVLALFALTFLLDLFETPPEGGWFFWAVAGAFAGALALDLFLGGLIRARMMKCELPKRSSVRWSRVMGAVCALMNVILLFGVIAGLLLAVFSVTPVYPAFLVPVYESEVWTRYLSVHVYDLFIIAICFVFVRVGLRVGLVKAIYYLLMFALTLASVYGAIFLANKVGIFESWGAALTQKITFLPPAAATVLGHGVFAILFFAVLFALVILIGWLLHKGLRRMLDCRAIGMISSILLFLILLAVFFIVMCGIYYGAAYLAEGMTSQFEFLGEFALGQILEGLLTSSQLSAIFYYYNPLLLILG